MIKLLIVDDEPLVQIGIKSMLNWADYGIEVCGTAVNGANALELIEEAGAGQDLSGDLREDTAVYYPDQL